MFPVWKRNSLRFWFLLIRFYEPEGSVGRCATLRNFIGYFRTWLKSTSITDSTFRKPLNICSVPLSSRPSGWVVGRVANAALACEWTELSGAAEWMDGPGMDGRRWIIFKDSVRMPNADFYERAAARSVKAVTAADNYSNITESRSNVKAFPSSQRSSPFYAIFILPSRETLRDTTAG